MSTRALSEIHERYLVLPADNIDTDQIIPARFLTTIDRAGLGQHAFADWRGAEDCPLNDPRAADCGVLIAGDNFGCGSSREHAPWALLDLGFKAIVSTSFADTRTSSSCAPCRSPFRWLACASASASAPRG